MGDTETTVQNGGNPVAHLVRVEVLCEQTPDAGSPVAARGLRSSGVWPHGSTRRLVHERAANPDISHHIRILRLRSAEIGSRHIGGAEGGHVEDRPHQ